MAKEEHVPTKLVISGSMITATVRDEQHKVNFKVDLSATPHTIDLTPQSGPNEGKTMKAVFELKKGDTLRICLDEKDRDRRPTAVASKPDSGLTLAVFQREGAREPAGRQRRIPKAIRSSEN